MVRPASGFLDRLFLENSSLAARAADGFFDMKKSKFTEAQIAFVLKQAEDGTPIGEVCRKPGSATRRSTIGGRSMLA
jgi:putative transposase